MKRSLARFGAAVIMCAGPALDLIGGPARAAATDPADSAGIEEIVVTATRREERLQDVPVSVTAFSQEKIDAAGLKNIDDVARVSPGLTFQRNGVTATGNYNDENSDIAIRGID